LIILKFYKKLKEYFDVFVIKKYFGKTQYTAFPNIRVLQSEKQATNWGIVVKKVHTLNK